MSKSNKIAMFSIITVGVIVICIAIIAYFKYQDVRYINSHIQTVNVKMSGSDDMTNINSGEYQYVDYKPNGKELDFKQDDNSDIYTIDLDDKRIKLTKSDDVDYDHVMIKSPNKKVKFSLFKSFNEKAKTEIIMNKDKIKEVGK